MHELRFSFPLPHGLHARPASAIEAVARLSPATIRLRNERTGVEVDAKSVLAMIGADIRHDDTCLLRLQGPDAERALAALAELVRSDFGGGDEALAPPPAERGKNLPRALKAAGVREAFSGTIGVRGVGAGVLRRCGGLALAPDFHEPPASSSATEREHFVRAVTQAGATLEREIANATGPQAGVLRAHLGLLRDPTFADAVAHELESGPLTVARAIIATVEKLSDALRHAESAYLRERVLDLQDTGARLLVQLHGEDALARLPLLDGPSVLCADALTPGQFLRLDRDHLRGLVLASAGLTSHTLILARSFGIPTLTGVAVPAALADGTDVVVDALGGFLIADPAPAVRRYFTLEERAQSRRADKLHGYRQRPGASRDGAPLPVLANVGSPAEVLAAIEAGADGIGLFRTEMIFLGRAMPPSEAEQSEIYCAAVIAARGHPVTFRTLDAGGDKALPYLRLPAEPNPFLGRRGARLYDDMPELLGTQLRAIFRAAVHGPVRIMAPMITTPEEMQRFRAAVDEARQQLDRSATFASERVPIGMMLEVPAAVFALPEMAAAADFFSVGSNDLAQYFFAADRENARVRKWSDWRNPAFLRLLHHTADAARVAARPLSLCGELAEDPAAQTLLLGWGFSSISLATPRVLAAKATLAAQTVGDARALAARAVMCADHAAVERVFAETAARTAARPLSSPDVIALDVDASSKAEAIKVLVDLLAAEERTADARALEEAVWTREDVYPTGFGHGFAMPHCKSASVAANTVALVRLKVPVEWGALDGEPVRVVILLAMRDGDDGKEHMRVFSRLSRLVMREEFRRSLEQAGDRSAVLAVLREQILSIPAAA